MSGCLQVGSVRALSSYFAWLSLPSTQNAQILDFTGLRVYLCSSLHDNCCICCYSFFIIFQLPSSLSTSFFFLVLPLSLFVFDFFLPQQDFAKQSDSKAQKEERRTGERVCLVCPEIALKPALISSFCSTSQFRHLQLTGQHRMVHSIYPTLLFQPYAPSKESLVTVFRMSFIGPST